MPEGDSIHGLALRLAPVLEGRAVTAFVARRMSNEAARTLVGRRIVRVDARGKNLLIRFDDERVLHIHLRMEGRLFVERPRSSYWAPERTIPDLRIVVAGASIVGRRLPVLRLLTAAEERRAPDLPDRVVDLVREDYDEVEAVQRIRALADREIADALLVQHAAAGIGNVYKSEVLFLERIHPESRLSMTSDDELRAVLRRASLLLRRNLGSGPRTTRPTLGGSRLWVYGRGGKPCFRCKTPIVRVMQGPQGGRSTYFCPTCQVVRAPKERP